MRFIEYCFNCDQLASGTLNAAQQAKIQAEKNKIAVRYPLFPGWKAQGKIGQPGAGYKPLYCSSSGSTSTSSPVYIVAADPTTVTVAIEGSGGSLITSTINVGMNTCALGCYATSSGIEVLLVSGDSAGVGVMKAYWDTDDDGFVDASTETTIIGTSDALGVVAGFTWVETGAGARYYAIDKDSSKIYNLTDTNSDEVPDDLGTVFASPTQFPEIDGAQSLYAAEVAGGAEALGVSFREDWLLHARHHEDDDESWVNLRDTNGDDVADRSGGLAKLKDAIEYEPGFVDGVFKNKTQLTVDAPAGAIVEVRAWESSTGDFTELLGTAVTGADETATVSLVLQR